MKKIITLIVAFAMIMLIAGFSCYAEGEVTQTVLRTIIDDSTHDFVGQKLTAYGTSTMGMTSGMSYSGTSSYKYSNTQAMMRYRSWTYESIAQNNASVQTAVDNGTAYICGWFYYSPEIGNFFSEAHITLISEGGTKSTKESLKAGEWKFYSAKIGGLTDGKATNGVIDTRSAGSIYIDDLCIVSTSDGSAPVPTARSYSIIGKTGDDGPNRYAKVLSVVFDGSAATGGVGPQNATIDSEFVKPGLIRSVKVASTDSNAWYLSDAKAISTNSTLTNYCNNGNLYWTAWAYVTGSSGGPTVGGQKIDPGKWCWVCKKITDSSKNAEWVSAKTNTIYLTDIKLMAFEDKPSEELQIDSFITTGTASSSAVSSGAIIESRADVFNNTKSNKSVFLITAEYSNNENELIGSSIIKIPVNTYRSAQAEVSYNISETAGNKVKVFLWNADTYQHLLTNKEFLVQ